MIVLCAGCAGSARTGKFADSGSHPGDIVLLSDGLAEHVQFSADGVRTSGFGAIAAVTVVRAASARPVLVDYRFVFLNRAGEIVQPVMDWTIIRLEPGRTTELRARAPRDSARDARLEIRWAR